MSTENSEKNGNLSMQDAISLLSTPPVEDTAEDELATEPQEVLTSETDAEDYVEEEVETDRPDMSDEADDDEEYDDGETDEAEYEPAPELYTVKVDGDEVEVDLAELLSGYSRQQAYTKRSQELAEQRRAFEQEAAEVKQMRDAYAQQLELLHGQLQQTTQQEPDWRELAGQYSAEDLFVMKAEFDKQRENLAKVEAERQHIAQQQARENQERMQQHLANQRLELLERIPSWRNEEVRNRERLEVIKYAKKAGFSDQDIEGATDARAVELLYKGWKYDSLQENAPTARKKVRKAPKMAKAGQPRSKKDVASRQRRENLKRLDRLKSVDAAVDYLMNRS